VLRVLAVAVLLAVAGCNAPASDPTPDATPVTPAPVPASTATGPTVFAPGVTDEGVTNPPRLARTHAQTLDTTSYTVNQTLVRRFDNGTVRSRYATRARFAEEQARFRASLRQVDHEDGERTVQRTRRFGDGDRAYVASTEGNRTDYRLLRYPDGEPRPPSNVYVRNLTNPGTIERLFTLVDTYTVETFTENGTRYAHLRTVEPETLSPLQNVTLSATVSERGVVTRYRLDYSVTRTARVETTVVVSYTNLGNTTVERPAWVDRVNETAT
jgi:hypothetical protein